MQRTPTFSKPVGIATDEQWSVVFDGMEGAVSPSGTAHVAGAGAKYKWAGKTGTAQVVTVKQTESTKHKDADERKREHAWFIAFAPADDPKIAISVLVENAGFGASNAAPSSARLPNSRRAWIPRPVATLARRSPNTGRASGNAADSALERNARPVEPPVK